MDAIANFLFVIISGATVGAAIAGAAIRIRLFRRSRDMVELAHVALKTGYAMTTSTLLWVVTGTGVEATARVWMYLSGAALAAGGLIGVVGAAIQKEAREGEKEKMANDK